MCGIAGIVDLKDRGGPDAAMLDRMVAAMTHRGPDDRGVAVGPRIAMGMRRLSIIDVEGGHQPIENEDGTVRVVMNGELYSYPELRTELVSCGHRFRTCSDTEVLVHGYEEWGMEGLLARLNGMFAFALQDERTDTLFLARDRLGMKPIVYSVVNGELLFASGLTALLASGRVAMEPDPTGVRLFLRHQFVPAPYTVLRGVAKLPPACYLTVRGGRVGEPVRYWRLPPTLDNVKRPEAWEAELRDLLDDAVRIHVRSDVEVGAFLSGGLDSSIIVGLMSRQTQTKVRAFSIGFEDGDHDESKFAAATADRFGVELHHCQFRAEHVIDLVRERAGSLEEPLADPACLPTMLLAAEARRAVKVVLSGEGADELFAGYGYYRRFVGLRSRVAGALHRANGRRSASGYPYAMTHALVERLTPDLPPEGVDARRAESAREKEYLEGSRGLDPLNRALRIDTAGWLPDDLLMKVDRTTMAYGLEARVPFLDHRVVELAMRMPANVKLRDGAGKWVLRSAFRDLLPTEVAQRPKHGFNVPLANWFRGPLRTLISEDFPEIARTSAPWLSTRAIRELVTRHVEGGEDLARPLWTAYALAAWFRDAAASCPRLESRTPAHAGRRRDVGGGTLSVG